MEIGEFSSLYRRLILVGELLIGVNHQTTKIQLSDLKLEHFL